MRRFDAEFIHACPDDKRTRMLPMQELDFIFLRRGSWSMRYLQLFLQQDATSSNLVVVVTNHPVEPRKALCGRRDVWWSKRENETVEDIVSRTF